MNAARWLESVSPSLRRRGLVDLEIYLKEGRSRRFELGPQGVVASHSQELGWALRASSLRTSMFVCGTGEPSANGPWPAADGYPLQLPPVLPAESWTEPADLDAPLMVEGEALQLLEACARELERELPGARLLSAILDDGSSMARIASSNGIDTSARARMATLFLEAAVPGAMRQRVTELVAGREARDFNPRLLGRRLTDRLIVRTRGTGIERDRAPCVLAPPVAIRILGGLLSLLIGPDAAERARAKSDRQGRVAAEKVTIVDDPRLADGPFSAATDGEGVPTRALTLVEEGVFRRPLLGWWQAASHSARPAGCLRRPSWREPPQLAPSHLFIRPDRSVPAHSLLSSVVRGYYLLEVLPGAWFDLDADRFRLPVAGFRLEAGRASRPIDSAVLQGRIGALLHGIQGVARDLTFYLAGSALGSPTLLVHGLEITASDE